jgi:hypothetical protein
LIYEKPHFKKSEAKKSLEMVATTTLTQTAAPTTMTEMADRAIAGMVKLEAYLH